MTITDALITSVIGICVVMLILAIIAVLIILVSKVIRTIEAKAEKSPAKSVAAIGSPAAAPVSNGTNNGEVELIGTDEKTAAVIMAIVSQKSEIPLNRLSFKSIRLMDENEKGGDK